jgi:hypothetical protein
MAVANSVSRVGFRREESKMPIAIEDGLRGLLPEVALEYLREIVLSDDTVHAIRLVPVRLWLDAVQEIVCENSSGASRRRVFGFTPVSAEMSVSRGESEIVVRLAA